MGWKERRNGHRYYYRSRREGDRVVTDYIGAGALAETAAIDNAARQAQRESDRVERERVAAISSALAEQQRRAKAVVASALESAGYHRHHRGGWRKKRHA